MREIGSEGLVADDLDLGAIPEGRSMHIAPLRDAHFGEAGAMRESPFSNLRHRFWYGDAREAGATRESTFLNLRHRFWYGDVREVDAIRESTDSNLRH